MWRPLATHRLRFWFLVVHSALTQNASCVLASRARWLFSRKSRAWFIDKAYDRAIVDPAPVAGQPCFLRRMHKRVYHCNEAALTHSLEITARSCMTAREEEQSQLSPKLNTIFASLLPTLDASAGKTRPPVHYSFSHTSHTVSK